MTQQHLKSRDGSNTEVRILAFIIEMNFITLLIDENIEVIQFPLLDRKICTCKSFP